MRSRAKVGSAKRSHRWSHGRCASKEISSWLILLQARRSCSNSRRNPCVRLPCRSKAPATLRSHAERSATVPFSVYRPRRASTPCATCEQARWKREGRPTRGAPIKTKPRARWARSPGRQLTKLLLTDQLVISQGPNVRGARHSSWPDLRLARPRAGGRRPRSRLRRRPGRWRPGRAPAVPRRA